MYFVDQLALDRLLDLSDPLRDRRVSPPGHAQEIGVIAGEVAAMDRFIVRDHDNVSGG
jgi:hypothetical protein